MSKLIQLGKNVSCNQKERNNDKEHTEVKLNKGSSLLAAAGESGGHDIVSETIKKPDTVKSSRCAKVLTVAKSRCESNSQGEQMANDVLPTPPGGTLLLVTKYRTETILKEKHMANILPAPPAAVEKVGIANISKCNKDPKKATSSRCAKVPPMAKFRSQSHLREKQMANILPAPSAAVEKVMMANLSYNNKDSKKATSSRCAKVPPMAKSRSQSHLREKQMANILPAPSAAVEKVMMANLSYNNKDSKKATSSRCAKVLSAAKPRIQSYLKGQIASVDPAVSQTRLKDTQPGTVESKTGPMRVRFVNENLPSKPIPHKQFTRTKLNEVKQKDEKYKNPAAPLTKRVGIDKAKNKTENEKLTSNKILHTKSTSTKLIDDEVKTVLNEYNLGINKKCYKPNMDQSVIENQNLTKVKVPSRYFKRAGVDEIPRRKPSLNISERRHKHLFRNIDYLIGLRVKALFGNDKASSQGELCNGEHRVRFSDVYLPRKQKAELAPAFRKERLLHLDLKDIVFPQQQIYNNLFMSHILEMQAALEKLRDKDEKRVSSTPQRLMRIFFDTPKFFILFFELLTFILIFCLFRRI